MRVLASSVIRHARAFKLEGANYDQRLNTCLGVSDSGPAFSMRVVSPAYSGSKFPADRSAKQRLKNDQEQQISSRIQYLGISNHGHSI